MKLIYIKSNIDSKDIIKGVMYESHIFNEPYNIYIQEWNIKNMITKEIHIPRVGNRYELLYHYKTIPITNISEERQVNSNVFPNPATDFINIKLAEPFITNLLDIFDNKGQKVLSKEIQQNIILPVTDFATGMYYFKVSNKNSSTTHTISITK